jgi:glutathione S-transferase
MALEVWGRRNSFNVQKVMWLVGELDIACEHIPAGGDFGRLDTPAFLAMNPHGRVPVVRDGDLVVWESHSILRYLAATYGGGRFWAGSAGERSQIDRWMEWSETSLQPDFLMGVFWGFYRTPSHLRDTRAVAAKVARCADHMRILDRMLADQAFLAGGTLTLADISAGTALYRYFNLEIERPHVPNVEKWYGRLQQRAAYRENVMIPFDDLRGKLDY